MRCCILQRALALVTSLQWLCRVTILMLPNFDLLTGTRSTHQHNFKAYKGPFRQATCPEKCCLSHAAGLLIIIWLWLANCELLFLNHTECRDLNCRLLDFREIELAFGVILRDHTARIALKKGVGIPA